MHDYQLAREYQIKGSPTFVMNEGRQVLFGNVGYRVLRTNIEELLNQARKRSELVLIDKTYLERGQALNHPEGGNRAADITYGKSQFIQCE